MDPFDKKDESKVEEIQVDEKRYLDILQTQEDKVLCIPNRIINPDDNYLMPETYDFAKWVRRNVPEVAIAVEEGDGVKDLRSGDFWFPVILLIGDVSLQIAVNIVSNYIYDKIKGKLQHDPVSVHLETIFQDKGKKEIKKFSYNGSLEGLEKIKSNIDKFLEG